MQANIFPIPVRQMQMSSQPIHVVSQPSLQRMQLQPAQQMMDQRSPQPFAQVGTGGPDIASLTNYIQQICLNDGQAAELVGTAVVETLQRQRSRQAGFLAVCIRKMRIILKLRYINRL